MDPKLVLLLKVVGFLNIMDAMNFIQRNQERENLLEEIGEALKKDQNEKAVRDT